MIVTTYKARAKSVNDARTICDTFYRSLELHQEAGWLRGTCMTNVSDPQEVFIHEHWSNPAAWEHWKQSPADHFFHQKADPLLEGPWEIDVYQD